MFDLMRLQIGTVLQNIDETTTVCGGSLFRNYSNLKLSIIENVVCSWFQYEVCYKKKKRKLLNFTGLEGQIVKLYFFCYIGIHAFEI